MSTFKIRNDKGEYSNGKTSLRFTNRGKAWSSRGAVSLHLQHVDYTRHNCVIVEYGDSGGVTEHSLLKWTLELQERSEKRLASKVIRELQSQIEFQQHELKKAESRLHKMKERWETLTGNKWPS